jgi:hypothetical protein
MRGSKKKDGEDRFGRRKVEEKNQVNGNLTENGPG